MEPKKKIKKIEGFSTEPKRFRRGGDLLMRMPLPYEPRRQRRYIMEVPTSMGVAELWVNCERPTLETSREIPFMNSTTFIGRHEWQPIRVIFRDIVGDGDINSVIREVMDWSGSVSSGQYARTYKKNVTIHMVDPTGIYVESWHLVGAFPTAVMMTQPDFDDTIEFELTLNFDRCVINTN